MVEIWLKLSRQPQIYGLIFGASLITGNLLTAYKAHPLIWLVTYLLFWRATFVGRAVITLAIAWAVLCTWVGIFRWAAPFAGLKPQIVAFYLLATFCLSLVMIYSVAWGTEKIKQPQTDNKFLMPILAALIGIGFLTGSLIWQWLKV